MAFILGLLDSDFPAHVAQEDFDGEHAEALRLWQRRGFLSTEAGRHPVPSCPHCYEGTPDLLGGRYICNACFSTVDPRHLLLWRFDLEAFLVWLARSLKLQGGVQLVEERLWRLGSLTVGDSRCECFFRRSGLLTNAGRERLLAFRNVLILDAVPYATPIAGFTGPCLSLLEVLRQDHRSLKVTDLSHLLRSRGAVRFDAESGAVWMGDFCLGDVPIASKEYHLLVRLAAEQDRFVAYCDLKHYVLRHSGSTDTTDEASFCQKLKGRIKARVPKIDALIATTNKGDGYRLRGAL